MCGGGGGGGVRPPRNPRSTDLLYKEGIGQVAGMVEAVGLQF